MEHGSTGGAPLAAARPRPTAAGPPPPPPPAATASPAPIPPAPPAPRARRPRRRLFAAPRWWYLIDRRIVGAVALTLVVTSGAAAFATLRPSAPPAPVITAPELSPAAAAKARFIAKADRMCAGALARVKSLTYPATQTEAVAYVVGGLAIYSGLMDDLRGLKPPKRDRAALRKALRGFDKSLAATRAYLAALQSGSPARMAAAEQRVLATTIRANGLARAYGFNDCAESS